MSGHAELIANGLLSVLLTDEQQCIMCQENGAKQDSGRERNQGFKVSPTMTTLITRQGCVNSAVGGGMKR